MGKVHSGADNNIDDSNASSKENKAMELRDNNAHTQAIGIYTQDIVIRCKTNDNMIGIVTEVAGDMDSDSDMTDDDDDDDDEDNENVDDNRDEDDGNANAHDGQDDEDGKVNDDEDGRDGRGCRGDPLPADQVRVAWLDHSETTHNISDVQVVDRAFMQGDIVATASDPTGQVGVVEDVDISVDLLTATGSIVKDISSRYINRVRDFTVGDYVVLGPWLGRVDDVLDNVTVLFDDGSVCKVTKADPMRLKSVSKSILEDGHFPYYPGQRVRASSSSVFKNARWIFGVWKASRMEGTVTQVTVGSVFIYWIASAGYGPECATSPAEEQSPKNLKLLSRFSHTTWQVGDWCFLPSSMASSDIPRSKISSEMKHDDCIPGDAEGEHSIEGVSPEQTGPNHLSPPNIATMAIDPAPSLECPTENVQTNILTESRYGSSSLSGTKESVPENRSVHRKKLRKVLVRRDKKARKRDETFERALLIINTKTRVNVVWQDGRREHGLVSTTLIPIDNPSDQEFVAEQYVVEKATEDDDDIGAGRRVGVVDSVNAKERTACVRWLKLVSRPEDPREFDMEEVVSVYELERHPDYDYCYGDVVIRLTPVSISDGLVDLVEEANEQVDLNEDKSEGHSQCEKVEDTSNSKSHGNFFDLSWVGMISDLKDGDIEVTWADGMVSTVGPQAIYVVGRDDGDDSIGAESEISDDDAASWETVNGDESDTVRSAEEEACSQNTDSVISGEEITEDSEESTSVRNGLLSIPRAAFGFTSRLIAGLFLGGPKPIDPSISDYSSRNDSPASGTIDASERRGSKIESSSQESTTTDSYPVQSVCDNEEQDVLVPEATYNGKIPETMSTHDEPHADNGMHSCGNGSCTFKHFDTAKDPLDHFFLSANGQSNSGRKWLKKVQQDWSILQKNLPETIYVRVYEDRMDLLRAVIVGAYGTPYQDGLFVFDFHLPPDYPQVPPAAHYHSGGWRINPNLYEEGKVCLSLLNTWTGRGNEVWDPSSSSILQVLVSLQGLVLNAKPYFNEAGYDKQVGTAEGEKNSLSYNENTFLLTCKSIMYLLRKPPKDFEELIKDHFKKRGYYILKACDAYMKGYLIGSLTEDASLSDKSTGNSTSVGFKLMLAKILPKLTTALSGVGANVEEFKQLQHSC